MPYVLDPRKRKLNSPSFHQLYRPAHNALIGLPELKARGNRPLQMEFEDQLKGLIFFHLEEHCSGRHLLQVLEEDDYAREKIAPANGIKKSSFFEAINSRGLEQLIYVYEHLQGQATSILPKDHAELGNLMAIDGSLIDAVFSMYWADYRKGARKARVHLGFDLNRSIPSKFFLTDGKKGERAFASRILSPGQTGVMDRGYQCHKNFDLWQTENKYFVCRIQDKSHKTTISTNEVKPGSIVFYDAMVLLGIRGKNLTEKPVRLVGYKINGTKYWIATNRFDLSAEQIAMIYKLRWDIEKFFGWWKRHLKVYHLIARSEYGLMVQIIGGLITYLLLAIYCHEQYNEKVSIKRVRELRTKIRNETRTLVNEPLHQTNVNEHQDYQIYART
ncbi:MAG: IS4 family transposase [Deltaproteobacteria bacterium]|nr:IS4 family transposase [Deltaproteobacteria bacterium]